MAIFLGTENVNWMSAGSKFWILDLSILNALNHISLYWHGFVHWIYLDINFQKSFQCFHMKFHTSLISGTVGGIDIWNRWLVLSFTRKSWLDWASLLPLVAHKSGDLDFGFMCHHRCFMWATGKMQYNKTRSCEGRYRFWEFAVSVYMVWCAMQRSDFCLLVWVWALGWGWLVVSLQKRCASFRIVGKRTFL